LIASSGVRGAFVAAGRFLLLLVYALYLVVARTVLWVSALLLFTYFTLNSRFASEAAIDALRGALPGSITFSRLEIGPPPNRLRLLDVAIVDPKGRPVIEVGRLDARVDLAGLAGHFTSGARGVSLRFEEVVLRRPSVSLYFDESGRLSLVDTFDTGGPPSPDPAPVWIDIARTHMEEIRFRMRHPEVDIDARDARLQGRFSLRVGGGAPDEMRFGATDVAIGSATVSPRAMREAGLPSIPETAARVDSVQGSFDGIYIGGIALDSEGLAERGASMAIHLAPRVSLECEGLGVDTGTASPFLAALLGPAFDFGARLDGGFEVTEEGRFRTTAHVVGTKVRVAEFVLESVDSTVTVKTGPPDGFIVTVDAQDLDAKAYGGALRTPLLGYRLAADGHTHSVQGELVVDGLDPGALLRAPPIELGDTVAKPLSGGLYGTVKADVNVQLRERDADGVMPRPDVTVEVDSDVRFRRAEASGPLVHEIPALQLRGVTRVHVPTAAPPSLAFRKVIVDAVVGDTVSDEQVTLDGELDLATSRISLDAGLTAPRLVRLLVPLGVRDIDGSVTLSSMKLRGSFEKPELKGKLAASDLTIFGFEVTSARSSVGFNNGALTFDGLDVRTPFGPVEAAVRVRLFDGRIAVPRRSPILEVRNLHAPGVPLGRVLSRFQVGEVDGDASIDGGSITVDLARPIASLQIGGHVRIKEPRAFGESGLALDATLDIQGNRILVPRFDLTTRGGHGVHGRFELDRAGMDFMLGVETTGLPFSEIAAIERMKLPLRGSVTLSADVAGTPRALSGSGHVQLTDFAFLPVSLGSARVEFAKSLDGPLELSSKQFFKGLTLERGSSLEFEGIRPVHLSVIGQAADVDPFKVIGAKANDVFNILASGAIQLDIDFRKGREPMILRASVPKEGATITVGKGDLVLRNDEPTTVTVHVDSVDIGSTFVRMGRDRFEVCGAFLMGDPQKGVAEDLQLWTAGTYDVPVLGPLKDVFSAFDVRVDTPPLPLAGQPPDAWGVSEDPRLAQDPRGQCLRLGQAGEGGVRRGRLLISGSLDHLSLRGGLRLLESRLLPRKYGREIVLEQGAVLRLTPAGRPGRVDLFIPKADVEANKRTHTSDHSPLNGGIDDGRFVVHGRLTLQDFWPDDGDLVVDGVEVPHAVPKEYSVVLSPSLRFEGQDMTKNTRKIKLFGDVAISEGLYTKSFDKLAKAVGSAAGREVDQFDKPIYETLPALKALELNLHVRGANFDVKSRFPFGAANLELGMDLDVTGRLDKIELRRRVSLSPGGVISYSINKREFEVMSGAIDFNGDMKRPYLDIKLKTDVEMTGAVASSAGSLTVGQDLAPRDDTQIVTITMRVSGEFPLDKDLDESSRSIKIELSSNRGYDQADLMSIILTGQPLTKRSVGGASPSINLLTDNLADSFAKLLVADLVGDVSVGWTPQGDIVTETKKCFGKGFCVKGKVTTGKGETRYRAGFSIKLGDRWSFDGLLRSNLDESQQQAEQQRWYESKLRYRIPLQ